MKERKGKGKEKKRKGEKEREGNREGEGGREREGTSGREEHRHNRRAIAAAAVFLCGEFFRRSFS